MDIRYALIREGSSDGALQIIIERYAASHNITLSLNKDLSKPFNGPLGERALRIRTRMMFDSAAVELAFYFADRDKGEFNKLDKIQDAIKSVNQIYLSNSVIGVPDPHMEAWLLADHNAVKRIFNLPGDKTIPHANREPKARLETLANTCGDDELTPPEARKKLAEALDLKVVERDCASFRQFIKQYNSYINMRRSE